jgi:hypothetical protein
MQISPHAVIIMLSSPLDAFNVQRAIMAEHGNPMSTSSRQSWNETTRYFGLAEL